eukprot:TRINITY_DN2024_c0_g1_i2.p2 TRINITY_DN2024_c0_g1~~TRINITY_DN2024_c0_g1_i2.p2  ORF type:complete len:110 (+),score=9.72 TRINITY_DN2024_c0_g1_i2:1155-1484(+)
MMVTWQSYSVSFSFLLPGVSLTDPMTHMACVNNESTLWQVPPPPPSCAGVALLIAVAQLLIAGFEDQAPQLVFCDPSGIFTWYKAKAINSGNVGAHTNIGSCRSPSART